MLGADLGGEFVVIGMTERFKQRPRSHVRSADAQGHHAAQFLAKPAGGGLNVFQQAFGLAREHFPGQRDEGRIQRLFVGRDFALGFPELDILEHLVPRCEQFGFQFLKVLGRQQLLGGGRIVSQLAGHVLVLGPLFVGIVPCLS